MRWLKLLVSLIATLSVCASIQAAWTNPGFASERVVLPIYQDVVHGHGGDGFRYWLWLTIGNEKPMKVLLDTGSSGLFVLASGLTDPDTLPVAGRVTASYDYGDVLLGRKSKSIIAFGKVKSLRPVRFGLVTSTDCAAAKPDCIASRTNFEDYRIVSEGIAGQGYSAIAGVSLGVDLGADPLPNPFTGVAQSWVIELPTPGQWTAGKLILNPDERDLVGYQTFEVVSDAHNWQGAIRSGIPGCVAEGDSGESVCGGISFDSGANSILVDTRDDDLFQTLQNAGSYAFEFGDGENKPVWRAQIPPNAFVQTDLGQGRAPLKITLGYHVMWNFRIFYDYAGDTVGLKQR